MNIQDSRNNYVIEDFNRMGFFEVKRENEGDKVVCYIKRIKISASDSRERILRIEEMLKKGDIWCRKGSKREGTIRYASPGLNPSQIQSIILTKTDKTDVSNKSEISIDITKEHVEDQVEKMTKEDMKILERIVNALNERFGKQNQPAPSKMRKSS